MATQKPISTISYNTEEFLKEKLDTWLKAHIIQSYMYIKHKGEDGDKDHIHLRIEPNKKLDPMDLAESLREYKQGQEKPLGVRPFRPSKEEDWVMYALHNEDYLKLKYGAFEKGEKLPYEWTDIKAPEDFDVEIAYIRALQSLKHSNASIAKQIRSGENPINLVMSGENVFAVNAIMRAYQNNDYMTLAKQYNELQADYNKLLDAIDKAGFAICCDDAGNPILQPYETLNEPAGIIPV